MFNDGALHAELSLEINHCYTVDNFGEHYNAQMQNYLRIAHTSKTCRGTVSCEILVFQNLMYY